MDKIEAFLDSQRKSLAADREETLIALGLFEKEYAPNGKFSYQYKEYDIENGEKRYYRKKALAVTEEQWTEIIKMQEQLEEIEIRKAKKEETQRKKSGNSALKKWIPVFAKREDSSEGESKIAMILRIVAMLWALTGGFVGIVFCFDEGLSGFIMLAGVVVSVVLLYAMAEILSYLAELTAIAREGVQYSEKE